jgi:serine/threonine protein kinase
MEYLNCNLKIFHRDLKGENIFLVQNGARIETKIGDFGHSLNRVNKFNKHGFNIGTLGFMVILFSKNSRLIE